MGSATHRSTSSNPALLNSWVSTFATPKENPVSSRPAMETLSSTIAPEFGNAA